MKIFEVKNFSVDYAGLYISWATTSLFIIPDTILIKKSPFIKEAIFSDAILVSNYHVYKEEKIKLILDHMINIIYKTVTPSSEKSYKSYKI